MNSTLEYIVQVLRANGLVIEEEITETNYRQVFVNIADEIDSLLYMSLLVEIEEHCGIELPDEMLTENIFYNIDDFVSLLDDEINENQEEKIDVDLLDNATFYENHNIKV